MVHCRIVIFLFLGLLSGSTVTAQSSAKQRSMEAIQALREGAIVVRLPSKRNKLKALNEALAKDNLDAKTRARYEAEIEKTIEKRDRYNRELVNAMEELYDFSALYFVYDTAVVQLKSGVKEGIFVNENLESDPQIRLEEKTFFVLRMGTTKKGSTTGLEALVVADSALDDLTAPFPYYVRTNHWARVFLRIFSPKKVIKKDARRVVGKLNKNLHGYHERVLQRLAREESES